MPSPAAPTRSRWPAATAPRRSSPRSRRSSTSLRLRAGGNAKPLRTRSGSRPRRCRRALDAFVDGGERRVDLGEVNGRVFVNNVSLGVYAEAVQRSGYRGAKLRTLLDTVPDTLGPSGSGLDLRWTDPDGQEHSSGAVILVSNNRYRLGPVVGSEPAPRSMTACSGSRSPGRRRAVASAGARRSDRSASGAPRPSRFAPTNPFPPGSTARRCDSRHPAVLDPLAGPASARRAPASRRIAVGAVAGGLPRRRSGARTDRGRR